jgi:hypothetical protein
VQLPLLVRLFQIAIPGHLISFCRPASISMGASTDGAVRAHVLLNQSFASCCDSGVPYKTGRAEPRYRTQVQLYALALQRATALPARAILLAL